ncbi:uncharacterized protein [Diadema setosum]|uniref:uncharacterized protein n=1 Tax=Diadema setosum TaxID=31175 RepID=UPI003B3BA31E
MSHTDIDEDLAAKLIVKERGAVPVMNSVESADGGVLHHDINPEDSVSQCGRSSTSSTSSRLKAMAKRAALEVEAAALAQRQEYELEELRLKQRKAQLALRIELQVAKAQEQVYQQDDAAQEGPPIEPPVVHASTPSRPAAAVNAVERPREDETLPYPPSERDAVFLELLQQGQQQQQRLLESVSLPQIDLERYDGNPLKFHEFWRGFENCVDQTTVSDAVKLDRLLRYCAGDVRRLLQPCLIMKASEGYHKAKSILQEKYGDPVLIADAWLRKVTEGKRISPQDRRGLGEMADEILICVRTLEAIGQRSELTSQRVLLQVTERLPYYLRARWLKVVSTARKDRRLPSISDLVTLLQEVAKEENDPVFGRLLERDVSKTPSMKKRASSKGHRGVFTASTDDGDVKTRPCVKCKGNHTLFGCEQFKQLEPDERLKLAKDEKLCFNCLKKGHGANGCKVNRVCTVKGCGKKHTKFLHLPRQPSQPGRNALPPNAQETRRDEPRSSSTAGEASNHSSARVGEMASNVIGAGSKIALPIVAVRVRAKGKDTYFDTYALLDSGSTSTFCTTELTRKVEAEGGTQKLSMSTLDRSSSVITCKTVSLEVESLSTGNRLNLPHVYAKEQINVSRSHIVDVSDTERFPHLADVDVPKASPRDVMLLIGQDVPEALVPLDVRRGKAEDIYAVKTVLGWTVNGPVGNHHSDQDVSSSFISRDANLELQVERFWSLESTESLADQSKCMSVNDRRALDVWDESIQKEDGHYQLSIPFKERPPKLADNMSVAERRLQSLGRRLRRDEDLHRRYTKAMTDLVEEGYAEKVAEENAGSCDPVWYLPHHPVENPNKPGKTRIVFDCASTFLGRSLNDAVLQGPDLTNSLLGVLLRFRQEPIAVMGDIKAMFNQVRVPPDERDLLRFLWWPEGDVEKQPEVYRMCVHLFGGTWCPSVCSFALRRTSEDQDAEFSPEAVNVVKRNFYVDDCLVSVKEEDKAVQLVDELKRMLKGGGFNLTKWLSNSPKVMESVPVHDRAKEVEGLDLTYDALPIERALGVKWNIELDTMTYGITPKHKPCTRRGVLSEVCSVYDPYGFASPYVLNAKVILQELTAMKLDWDDPLPEKQRDSWLNWKRDLPLMEDFNISRCLKPHDFGEVMEYQLHHFSDASERAYGVASYLRVTNQEGKVYCSLVMARTRLTPLKRVTIPRLELMAATLAVRVDSMLRRELDFNLKESVFWSDSTIVLQYIKNVEKRFHTFVGNRIAVIHEGSEPKQWRYVDTRQNPADDVSRGMTAEQLMNSDRWVNGPIFLWSEEELWPGSHAWDDVSLDGDPEVKSKDKAGVYMSAEVEGAASMSKLLEHYSSWHRLKKAVCWLRRYLKWLRGRFAHGTESISGESTSGNLTVEEMKEAEEKILQYVQSVNFPDEIFSLQADQNDDARQGQSCKYVKKISSIYKLDPRMINGLLRVGGRLGRSVLPEDAKHPIILRHDSHVAKLILREIHETSGHSGKNHILSRLNQKYWIPAAGSVIRGLLARCVVCRRQRGKVLVQKMADLPADRLTPDEPPFSRVGIDYFGPFELKRGRSVVKRYGVLFTCLSVRAVHLEMADSLDTDSCINAIRRFIARRGNVREIRSDNGTNLVGAERELRAAIHSWNQAQIHETLLQKNIKWTFNPPAASHQGGVWERQIRTVRKLLCSLVRQQTLNDDSLHTLFCEVEGIINSRPITGVSTDVNDVEALTPNHLLLLNASSTPPPVATSEADNYARRRWRQVQFLADTFWTRWRREYLPRLQERQKWATSQRNVHVGDLVLVVDEHSPRNVWPLGRVLQTWPDEKGFVRQCEVKTRTSILRRPVTKLCLILEADS